MKVLLVAINAKYIHSNPAVYSLKAYARQYKQNVEIAEYTINQHTDTILADIYKKKPNVIAISCYIWNWEIIKELLEEIPKVLPDVPIWLGGPEVSYDAPKVLEKHPTVTGVMVFEGEKTFYELLAHYCDGAMNLRDIKGICLPGDGMEDIEARPLMNLDEVPFFYDDLNVFENRILYYETSRGCPFRCSYCLSSIDKTVRLRSIDKVKKELQFFLDNNVPQVKFIDRTFNCNHEHAKAIWEYIQEHDNKVTNFHFEIAADIITEDELNILSQMRPGLIQLEIGVQTTNPETIKEIKRTMNLDKVRSVVSRIHDMRNIHQHLDLIVGLPYENYESFIKSFNDVYMMEPDQLQLGFLKVLKGSYMQKKALDYEISYLSKPPYEVLKTKWISYDEVLTLKNVEEMVELYYNSNQFVNTIRFLVKAFESPFHMFYEMSHFFEDNGLFTNVPARSYRYDVLLKFAKTWDMGNEDIYRELLTLDMYLREKCKSRPAFARDLSEYKGEIYKREESKKDHVEVFFYPVWQCNVDASMKQKVPYYVKFDYEDRDPLSNNANIKCL